MDKLRNLLGKWKCEDIDNKIDKFIKYREQVLAWNEKLNMTAITDEDEFEQKHFLDSVAIYNFEEMKSAEKIVDIGTGAGFPGVPLAILFPEKEFVLVDSLKKRLLAIDDMVAQIGIKNVCTIHTRAEDLGRNKEHREKYDLCVSRAVANLATLSEYCLPLVKAGGVFLAYKGEKAKDELSVSKEAIRRLGGKIKGDISEKKEEKNAKMEKISTKRAGVEEIGEINEIANFNHQIVRILKVEKTPKAYPRKAGVPAKSPLGV